MEFCRKIVSRTGFLIVAGVAAASLLAGCTGGEAKPKVGSSTTGSPPTYAEATSEATSPSATATSVERPRHRVGETNEEWKAIVGPYKACLKDHGADTNLMPPNIKAAERWVQEHSSAYQECAGLQPQPPWGEDPANPEYRNNIHQWVKCMNDRGLNVVETGDVEQPWRFGRESKVAPEQRQHVEAECEKEVMAKFDR